MNILYIVLSYLLLFLSVDAYGQTPVSEEMNIHNYFVELAQREPTENHRQLVELTDPEIIHRKLNVEQMSDFIKSTRWQTRMVYAYSKSTKRVNGEKVMSPYELIHSLADDLFQRKALQKFVSKRQKDGLLLRRDIVDWALEKRCFTEEFLEKLASEYDRHTFKQKEDNREVQLL